MNAEIRSVIRCALEAAIEDYYLSGESVQAFEDALAWLDAQPAAPEEMTIPEDVRNWIASAAQVASDSARYYDVDPSTSDAVLAWLDAQPAAPEPDWTLFDWDDDPPDCFIMSPWGNTLHYFHAEDIDAWWGNMPDMEAVHANSRMIVDVDQSTTLGIDWRTTLRRRRHDHMG